LFRSKIFEVTLGRYAAADSIGERGPRPEDEAHPRDEDDQEQLFPGEARGLRGFEVPGQRFASLVQGSTYPARL
jgi:hypothetical protein